MTKTTEQYLDLRRRLNDYFPGRTPIDLDSLSTQKLKKEAWRLCSLCVRFEKADPDGLCSCVTCDYRGAPVGSLIQAGHGVRHAGVNAVKFFEPVIFPQCSTDNCVHGGKEAEFVLWLQQNHPGVLEETIERKYGPSLSFTKDTLIEMILEYEIRLEKYLP